MTGLYSLVEGGSLFFLVGGDRKVEAWEKRGRRQEKRGWEEGVPRCGGGGPGDIEKNFCNILQ